MLGNQERRDWLELLMTDAIRTNGANAEIAIDAFVKALLADDDAALLIWELVAEIRMTAIRRLFTIVLHRVQQEDRAFSPSGGSESGQPLPGTQIPAAASPPPGSTSSTSRANATVRPGGPMPSASAKAPPANGELKPRQSVPAAPPLKHGSLPVPPQPQRRTKAPEALMSAAYRSWYEKERVNGKMICDMTRDEAEQVAKREERLAKWILLLIAQIPPGDKKPIKDFITPEESDRYFHMAQQQTAA
jgi:hypothetical protein